MTVCRSRNKSSGLNRDIGGKHDLLAPMLIPT
jgi:hypothetical protein